MELEEQRDEGRRGGRGQGEVCVRCVEDEEGFARVCGCGQGCYSGCECCFEVCEVERCQGEVPWRLTARARLRWCNDSGRWTRRLRRGWRSSPRYRPPRWSPHGQYVPRPLRLIDDLCQPRRMEPCLRLLRPRWHRRHLSRRFLCLSLAHDELAQAIYEGEPLLPLQPLQIQPSAFPSFLPPEIIVSHP